MRCVKHLWNRVLLVQVHLQERQGLGLMSLRGQHDRKLLVIWRDGPEVSPIQHNPCQLVNHGHQGFLKHKSHVDFAPGLKVNVSTVNLHMDGLERLQHVEGDGETFHRFDGVAVSKGDPEEAAQIEDVSGVVEEELLVPMGVAAAFDQDGEDFGVFVRLGLFVEGPAKFAVGAGQTAWACSVKRKVKSSS